LPIASRQLVIVDDGSTDGTCGWLAASSLPDGVRSLRLRERGFAIEPEIAARVLQAGERIHEVPIDYAARSRDEGKKLTALDGLRVLRTLVRCKLA